MARNEWMKGDRNPAKRPEVRRKISEAHTGKEHTQTTKDKISGSLMGRKRPDLTKHGDGIGSSPHHRLYAGWWNMMARCYRPNCEAYSKYGAEGVQVCPAWHDYLTFKEWALKNGWKPHLEQHRQDPDGDYGPMNSVWLIKKEHRRIHAQMRKKK